MHWRVLRLDGRRAGAGYHRAALEVAAGARTSRGTPAAYHPPSEIRAAHEPGTARVAASVLLTVRGTRPRSVAQIPAAALLAPAFSALRCRVSSRLSAGRGLDIPEAFAAPPWAPQPEIQFRFLLCWAPAPRRVEFR